jgi:dTDP-4-amino-4,6-dideoxygalactose transaminase
MWVRKRIEIGWSDIAVGMVRCLCPQARARVQARLEQSWSSDEDALGCLSVRTGFDLLLGALRLPRGSHVLMSAVNIGDMVRIVEHHGLVAVPVDLDPATMGPTTETVARAMTPAAKCIVIAHLFGGRVDIGPIVELAKERGLLVIEDCAQAFDGTGYRGHPQADASMFSFGPIKSCSALGGALLLVRDPETLGRMRERERCYPEQSRWMYLRRLIKYIGIKTVSSRVPLGLLVRLFKALRMDYDQIAGSAARGFAGPNFFERIRRRPSAVLLRVLERRLRRFERDRLEDQRARAELLRGLLDGRVAFPGLSSEPHTFWVFPVLVENPGPMAATLRRAGFDATQRQSLGVVAPPDDLPELRADAAQMVMDRIAFLPVYPEMSEAEIRRMAELIVREGRLADFHPCDPLALQELSRG